MRETRNHYTTSSNYTDHSSFGGYVYNYDFDGYISMSEIAARIISDRKFDKLCKINSEQRTKYKNYKKGAN